MTEPPSPATPEWDDPRLDRPLLECAGALRRGWPLIAACLLISLVTAVLFLASARRVYQATARLLVLPRGGRPLHVADTDPTRPVLGGAEDELPTHVLILSSPRVVGRAIGRVGLDRLPGLRAAQAAGRGPVEEAVDRLEVTRPDRQAQILRIDYRAGSGEEATRMLEAITDGYREFLEGTLRKDSGAAIALLAKARDDLDRELADLEARYLALRREAPALIVGASGRPFAAQRLEQTGRALGEARDKALTLKLQLELGRRLVCEGAELWTVAHALNQIGGDPTSLNAVLNSGAAQPGASDYLRQLTREQQQLAERFGPRNARAAELREQIARAQEARGRLEQPEVRGLLAALEQGAQTVGALEAELAARFERDLEEARRAESDLLAEANLRADLERRRALFHTVVDQLKQAQFAGDFDAIHCEVLEPAHAPGRPVWPRAGLVLGLALMAGGLVGAGAALAADRRDPRIRSPEELRAALGCALLGQVPAAGGGRDPGGPGGGEFGLIARTQPRSSWAEAYRAIRTRIEFLRRDRRVRVVQVTGPYPGDGKSVSASNLAISLALAGRKALLIDADLRRPAQHRIHGLRGDRGLTQVLTDLQPLERVVQRSAVDNLDLIAVGPEVPRPDELLASDRFAALLDEARRSYDVVIVDSAPLLAVADPAIIGSVADGIVLVVRPATLRRRDAARLAELLSTLGTPVLGAVINGVSRTDDGYGDYGYAPGFSSDSSSSSDSRRRPGSGRGRGPGPRTGGGPDAPEAAAAAEGPGPPPDPRAGRALEAPDHLMK